MYEKQHPDLASLADNYQIGSVLRLFAPHPNVTLFWSILGGMSLLASITIAILTATTLSAESSTGGTSLLALVCGLPLLVLVCLGCGAWILVGPRVEAQQMRVAVCEGGLLWCGRHLQVIRWDDIHVLWRNASLKQATKVRLTGPGRRAVVMPLYLDEWRTLVRWIERDMTAQLFPRILAQFERQHVARFGPITLTRRGIVVAHRPPLSWHEAYFVERGETLVLVRVEPETETMTVWAHVPFAQIPNHCVLKALFDHCFRVSLSPAHAPSTQLPKTSRTTRATHETYGSASF